MSEKNNAMKTLVIDENSIYKFKIENYAEFDESFFREVYEKAEVMLSDIIKKSKESEKEILDKIDNDFNNVIAFVGERGTGKTSSMLSFSESLRSKKNENGQGCYILDRIDPSIFDDSRDSIVEIIVSTMFKKFKDELKNNAEKNRGNDSSKIALINKFEEVYQDIKILNGDKKTIFGEVDESIEGLVSLSSAINMKRHLSDLIQKYLTYMAPNSDFLVISIDDLDMNIASGEKMIEEIRKYLVMPKVIILMAIRFEQLEMVVKQKNIRELATLVNHSKQLDEKTQNGPKENFEKIEQDLENKKNKYLEKIIPYNKRIYMPEIHVDNVNIKINLKNIRYNEEGQSLIRCMAKLYYDYLRYIIVTPVNYEMAVPNTLRELVEFLQFFDGMTVVREENEKSTILYNINIFKQYFKETLLHKLDNTSQVKFLQEVLSVPVYSLNRTSLLFLNKELKLRMPENDKMLDNDIAEYINEISTYSRSILEKSVNLGDVVTLNKIFSDMNVFIKEKMFSEFFKMTYSLRLLETLYSRNKDILYVIEKDVVGRYFEFADKLRDEHWRQINQILITLSSKPQIEDEDEIQFFYQLLEPVYNIKKVNNKRLYVDHVYTAEAKRGEKEQENGEGRKTFSKYRLKPLNILGITDDLYPKDSVEKNSTIYKNFEQDCIEINVEEYLLICNMDFYFELLDRIDKSVYKARLKDRQTMNEENRINLIYNRTLMEIDNLCKQCDDLGLERVKTAYFNKFRKQLDCQSDKIDRLETIESISTLLEYSSRIKNFAKLIETNRSSVSKYPIENENLIKIETKLKRILKDGFRYYIGRVEKPKFNIMNRMSELKKIDENFVKAYASQIEKIEEYIKDNKIEIEKYMKDNNIVFNKFDYFMDEEYWKNLEKMLNDLFDKLESDYKNIESDS